MARTRRKILEDRRDAAEGEGTEEEGTPVMSVNEKAVLQASQNEEVEFQRAERERKFEDRMKDQNWRARKLAIEDLMKDWLDMDFSSQQDTLGPSKVNEREKERIEKIEQYIEPYLEKVPKEKTQVVIRGLDLIACFAELAPLDMVQNYVRSSKGVGVLKTMVTHPMSSSKGADRSQCKETIISLCFAECGDVVVPTLLEGLKEHIKIDGKTKVTDRQIAKHKKCVAMTFTALASSLERYGIEFVPIDIESMRLALQFLSVTDAGVREAVKYLMKQYLLWSGLRIKEKDQASRFTKRAMEKLGFDEEESGPLQKKLTTLLKEMFNVSKFTIGLPYKTRSKSDVSGGGKVENIVIDHDNLVDEEELDEKPIDLWKEAAKCKITMPEAVSQEDFQRATKSEKNAADNEANEVEVPLEEAFSPDASTAVNKSCIQAIIDIVLPPDNQTTKPRAPGERLNPLGQRHPARPILEGSASTVLERLDSFLDRPASDPLVRNIADLIHVLVIGLQDKFSKDTAGKCAKFLMRSLATKRWVNHVGQALQVLFRKKRNLVVLSDYGPTEYKGLTNCGRSPLEECFKSLKSKESKVETSVWLRHTLVLSELESNKPLRLLVIDKCLDFCTDKKFPEVRNAAHDTLVQLLWDLESAEVPDRLTKLPDRQQKELLRKRKAIMDDRKKAAKLKKNSDPQEDAESLKDVESLEDDTAETSEESVVNEEAHVSDDETESKLSQDEAMAKAVELYGLDEEWTKKPEREREASYKKIISALSEKQNFESDEIDAAIAVLSFPTKSASKSKSRLELLELLARMVNSPPPRKPLEPAILFSLENKVGVIESTLLSIAEATSPGWLLRLLSKKMIEHDGRNYLHIRWVGSHLVLACKIIESFGTEELSVSDLGLFFSSIFERMMKANLPKNRKVYLKLAATVAARLKSATPDVILSNVSWMVKDVLVEEWQESTNNDTEEFSFFREMASHVPVESLKNMLLAVNAPEEGKPEEKVIDKQWLDNFFSELVTHERMEVVAANRKRRFAVPVRRRPAPAVKKSKPKIDETEPTQPASKPKMKPKARRKPIAKPSKPAKPANPSKLDDNKASNMSEVKRELKVPKRMKPKRPKAGNSIKTSHEVTSESTGNQELISLNMTPINRILEKLKAHVSPTDKEKQLINLENELRKARYRYPVNVDSCGSLFDVLLKVFTDMKKKSGWGNPIEKLLNVLTTLQILIGAKTKRPMKAIMPHVLEKCLDSQVKVRKAALKLLDTYMAHCGLFGLRFPPVVVPGRNSQIFVDLLNRLEKGIRNDTPVATLANLEKSCSNFLSRTKGKKDAKPAMESAKIIVSKIKETLQDREKDEASSSARTPPGPESVSSERTIDEHEQPSRQAPSPIPTAIHHTPRTPATRPSSMRVMSSAGIAEIGSIRGRRVQSVAIPGPPVFDDHELEREPELYLIGNNGRVDRLNRYMANRKEAIEKGGVQHILTSSSYIEDYSILEEDLRCCVSPTLCDMLTVPPNYFGKYGQAISVIKELMKEEPEVTVLIADVLLRWAAFRIQDKKTPRNMLTKVSDFVCSVCEVLVSSDEKLSEYEASALMPTVCGKLDYNHEKERQAMVECLMCLQDVIPADIVLVFLCVCLERPLEKNSCDVIAKQICQLIDSKCSSGAGLPVGVLANLAKVTYGNREVTGLAGAMCMARAHHHFGDELWELVGHLSDDQAHIIEERLVQVNGNLDTYHQTPSRSVTPSRFAAPTPQAPVVIRPSDYRLSVAPEPEASVKSALNSVLTSATPAKTRPAFGRDHYSSSQNQESVTRNAPDTLAFVLQKLRSRSWRDQEQGLSELYNDLQSKNSTLRALPSQIVPELSRCFADALDQIEGMKGSAEDLLILKRLLNAIMAYAREPTIIVKLEKLALERLLNDLLYSMVPDNVCGIDDWKQVRRGVNLVLLKVLEACPKNLLYTSLIHVLASTIRDLDAAETEAKRTRLSSKCSFCINSIAKTAQSGFEHCDFSSLLNEIDDFLKENPIGPENAKPTDQQGYAFRLLKTLVDRVVDELGHGIRNFLPFSMEEEKSQLVRYVDMMLESKEEAANISTHSKKVHFGPATGEPSNEDTTGGSGQVYLRRLKEIQHKYGIDTDTRATSDNPDSSVTDSTIVESQPDSSRVASLTNGTIRDTKAESISRAAALRERMARIRSGEM